ncbi:MAG: flagellar hook-associated protein FlgK [Actinomycetota bacterium]
MSNFLALHTGLSGVRAAQAGIETASNNISNVNTDGYTRQRVDLSAKPTLQLSAGRLGTGVDIDQVSRMREGFLDTRVRTTGESFAHADAKAELLQRVEDIVAEPETGLTGLLEDTWDAFEDLANDPSDTAARQQVLSSLGAVAGRFQAIDAGLDQLRADTASRLDDGIRDVNALIEDVDRLNKEIFSASDGNAPPNDLLDRRDSALDELTSLVGADYEVVTDEDSGRYGMVDVAIDGRDVVDADGVTTLSLDADGSTVRTEDDDGVGLGGELGALAEALADDGDLATWQGEVDAFARQLAGQIHDVYAEGVEDADGDDPPPLIGFPQESIDNNTEGAGNIRVNPDIGPDDIVAGLGFEPGPLDGRNAEAIADLRDSDLPGAWRSTVVELGRATAAATREADATEALHTAAQSTRQGAHGVSIDEEMVSLVQFQRALEASSRVMTTIDEAMDVLINRTGLVGR